MLTRTQLEGATTLELERLRDAVEAELTRRQEAELPERKERRGRTVMDERPHGTGTLRLELVKCGKRECKKDAEGGHGPYWYQYLRRGGKLTSRYIGKELPPELSGPRHFELHQAEPEPVQERRVEIVQGEPEPIQETTYRLADPE